MTQTLHHGPLEMPNIYIKGHVKNCNLTTPTGHSGYSKTKGEKLS